MKRLAVVCTLIAFGFAAFAFYINTAPASAHDKAAVAQMNVVELTAHAGDLPDNTVIQSY
jgi:hypothetical protein